MSPDRKPHKRRQPRARRVAPKVRLGPSADDEHDVVYFKRRREDDPGEAIPGRTFLDGCPPRVRATMRAVLVAVAAAFA